MPAGRLKQGIEIRMAGATLARDARELGLGDAGRLSPDQSRGLGRAPMTDGPIRCHYSPLVLVSGNAYCDPS
jgi:hypothetical protein